VYGNRRQRDFTRALAWLQTTASGPAWRELSKAQPGPDGRWLYGDVRWNDPHFASAEMCSAVGGAIDGALVQLGQWQDRVVPRELLFDPQQLPWIEPDGVCRVVAGESEVRLADRVAYALMAGEIFSGKAFLEQVQEAVARMSPDLPASALKKLGLGRTVKRTGPSPGGSRKRAAAKGRR
jgi:hypothetical protein